MSLALKCFLHNSLFIQSLSPCSVFSCCYFLFYFLSTLSHKIKQEVLLYLVEFYFLPVLVLFPLFLLTSCVYSKPQFACVFFIGSYCIPAFLLVCFSSSAFPILFICIQDLFTCHNKDPLFCLLFS